ncbi:MAG: protein phosphatase CheZ [Proteobacteria bacterium]|nr:protein phosphatase CheZ [Pseudomonadota bacterium]
MNTKCLMKVKAEDAPQVASGTKSKKSIKLAETSPIEETQNPEINELMTTDKKVIDQIGQLTRNLHDSLRELGYDRRLEAIAAEVPEAQDKLSYVATKTEQAAERTLNATEIAMPIQEKLSADAIHLSEQWKQAFEIHQTNPDTEKFKLLLIDTLQYLDKVPEQTSATNTQLMEIMMAQDFQDLTGQVIKKITHMVQSLEKDLIDLLLANVPAKKNITTDEGFMNGPVTNPEKRNDVVCNQDQVDDLLASLGF